MDKENICSFALSGIFAYEPRLAKAIIDTLGSAAAIFELDSDGLVEVLGPYNKHAAAIRNVKLEAQEKKLEEIMGLGFRYLSYAHPDFPPLLNQCEDGPCCLFVRSESSFHDIFSAEKISVVGTRDMSSYGRQWCESLVHCLGESASRPCIVSGLALGVDITAHKSALDCGLPTIAVLGTAIDNIYPSQHSAFARVVESSRCSAIISEYAPGCATNSSNFLLRNRIIAGLSKATVLIESKLKGGGMTTARLAASYNRSVFALPGRNDDLRSQGCNALIHAQIAEPVISCKEFLISLDYKAVPARGKHRMGIAEFYSCSTDAYKVKNMVRLYDLIRSNRDTAIPELCEWTGLAYKDVAALLNVMESDGFICVDLLQRCSICLH